jgi:hypothetical protein
MDAVKCNCGTANKSQRIQFYIQLLGPLVALISVLITIVGGLIAYNHQWEITRHDRLISEAHKVSDELTVLLFDGLQDVKDLNEAVDASKDWPDFFDKYYRPYLVKKDKLRRDMIVMHYKIERYFGADLATRLINTNMLIAGVQPDDLSKPSPCSMSEEAKKSIMITNEIIECEIRVAASTRPASDGSTFNELELLKFNNDIVAQNMENVGIYDRQIIQYIKSVNERLTAMGEVSVSVVVEN